MEENKKDFGPIDGENQNNDNYEYIDARGEDIIEVLDPYESEVIEVENKNKPPRGPIKPETPFMAKIPDAPVMDENYNASSTVILKKGDGTAPKPAEKKSEAKPASAGPAPAVNPALARSSKPENRSAVNPALTGGSPAPRKGSAVNPALFGGNAPEPEPEPEKKFQITPKKIAIAVAALILLIIIISNLTKKGDVTININDYTKVEFAGLNGQATALVTVDFDRMVMDYEKDVKVSKGNLKDLLQECVTYTVDKSTGLSAGDYVKVNWTLNNNKFTDKCNGKLRAIQISTKVGDLESMVDFDPFSGVLVKYEGNSGEADLVLSGNKIEAMPEIRFVASKSALIANGDEITLTLKVDGYDDVNTYCNEKGYNATATEKTYKVSGLNEYEKYDLFSDVTVSFTGFNGAGTVNVGKSSTAKAGISYEAQNADKLKNGDKIIVKAVGDSGKKVTDILAEEELAPAKLEQEYTVTGLSDPVEYSPFEYLSFEYSGISPDGMLTLNSDDVVVSDLVFTVDKPLGLSNGDELTVTVEGLNGADPYYICLKEGYSLTATEKKVTVTGLSSYVGDVSQVNADTVNVIDAAARNIMSSVISGLTDANTITGISYQGYYLQYPKSDDVTLAYNLSFGGNIHNRLYIVYMIDVKNLSGSFTYYWPIEFANLIVLGDGSVQVDTSEYIAGLNSFTEAGVNYYGYRSIDDFIASCIDSGSDVYDYKKGN